MNADVLISIGGGSAIDSGKGYFLHSLRSAVLNIPPTCIGRHQRRAVRKRRPMPDLSLAHIAIPTTTVSGSEVAPTCGLRDPAAGHKRLFRDDKLIPSIAVLDPLVTVDTPAKLTASSGMTAVARCIESLYSGRRNPLRNALALHGLRMLFKSLTRSISAPDDLEARADCLVASTLSAISANLNTSAVHAIGHVLGGRYGLAHGVPHAILLGPSMPRFMLPIIGDEQKLVLAAMGGSPDGIDANEAGKRASDLMIKLVATLPLPQRLGDVGVNPADIPGIAEQASRDPIHEEQWRWLLKRTYRGAAALSLVTLAKSCRRPPNI